DLWEYRKAAYDVVNGLSAEYQGKFQLVPVTMGTEGQSGERVPAIDECINWVKESHWIVLIVAWNYGHVGQDGRSVTECEYRYATESCKPPKTCFVYIAGDFDDGERAYIPDKHTVNLAFWKERDKVSDIDWERVVAFRNHLRDGRRFELFANLQDFKELLRNSLKRRIDRELQPQPRDPVFLTLLLKLKGKVALCIQTIRLLTNLKRMHDRLHKIRQLGVRRWREEVLTQWREGPLTSAAHACQTFVKGLREVEKHEEGLSVLLLGVSAEVPKVKEKIEKVMEITPVIVHISGVDPTDFSDASIKARSTPDEFEKAVDLYAGRVESAFSTANGEMLRRARELRKHYDDLQSGLSLARKQQGLTEEQDRRVGDEIELVRERFEELQTALSRHDEWQKCHERLERMDTSKATQLFEDDLERFLDRLEDVSELLDDLRSSIEMSEKSDEWSRKIDLVQNHSKRLKEERGEMAYDAMRKAFDDVFFDVDIATLSRVEAAERRVTDLDRALIDFEGKVLREKGPVVGVTL
ncbi:MAG: DUF4062 domain-containing protein, partial [Acidobacteria bacterium]|nr:DUF4062 domain-containing protein [Acidobacteriota bacterium]